MAQTLLTHEKMIENLIGEFSSSEHPEFFRAGFHFVADLIPTDHELWSSDNLRAQSIPTNGVIVRGGEGGGAQRHLKVISVWRLSSISQGVWTKCSEVSWADFRRGEDNGSIYSNAGGTMTPVYSISDAGRIFVAPEDFFFNTDEAFGGEVPISPSVTMAYFRYWAYEHNDFFGTSESGDSFDSYHITEDLFGFPRDAQLAAVIKSAMNILQVKIGESVHDDEDSELLQLQQSQMQQLQQWFESEMGRLNVKYKIVGLEEG